MKPAVPSRDQPQVVLRLYIIGSVPKHRELELKLRSACLALHQVFSQLEVIDIMSEPERVSADGVVAVPTVLRIKPLPTRRLIGDLSGVEDLLQALGINQHGQLLERTALPQVQLRL